MPPSSLPALLHDGNSTTMVKQRRLKQTQLTCGFDDCAGCYICQAKEKREIEFPPLSPIVPEKRLKKQAQLTCASADCVSCHICILKSRRSRSSNKNQNKESNVLNKDSLGTITPGKSFAKALIASSSNSKTSISEDHVAPNDDQECNASPTSLNFDSEKTQEVNEGPTNEDPLEEKKVKKRTRWSGEERKEVIWCYYLAKHKNLTKVKGTFSIWRERNPKVHQNICAIRLNTQ